MSKFRVKQFDDKPRYCRVPIYMAGERQIHIMQPYNKKTCEAGTIPKSLASWGKMIEKNGQIVISLEAVDDFCRALKGFKKDLLSVLRND